MTVGVRDDPDYGICEICSICLIGDSDNIK